MRTSIARVISIVPFFLLPPLLFAEGTGAKLDSVTIYTDRATVRRVMPVGVDAGGVVRFSDLPAAVLPDSIRASASNLDIVSVAVQPRAKSYEDMSDHPLNAKIESLQSEIRMETDRQSNYREQLKVLSSFGQIASGQSDRELKQNVSVIAGWTDALRFLEKNRQEYLEKIQKSERRNVELKRDLEKTSGELARILAARKKSQVEVVIQYAGTPRAGSSVSLEYTVTGVSWQAVYDLHGSSEGGDFRLDARAAVRQATGEDWNNVRITLSTARPSVALAPGQLRPWRISGKDLWTMDRDEGKRDDSAGETESSAGDSQDGASFSIQLPARETIESDNSDHRITLQSTPLKGTVNHVAIPSMTDSVFLRAKFRNSSSIPLLTGAMNIFLDGSFAGTTTTPRAAAGEDFDLYLGADQRMTARRVLLKGEVAGAGILSSKVQIQNQWQIEIANHSRKPRSVIVFDRYPVARDPNISTKFQGSNRSDVKPDANGMLAVNMNVDPGASQKFDFSYSLEIPQETWQKFQENLENEKGRRPAQPAVEPNAPAKQRAYDLERMLMH
ncbi:MAG: mucoidy inhibitor MuiA family protein [Leptospirales bacterium]|nr:mucoidy inhibitor MuiA family protein [Leptospirales bacterium]HNJ33375.1 DUF4139 domain-containing protein [Leptospiraceae bacterium]